MAHCPREAVVPQKDSAVYSAPEGSTEHSTKEGTVQIIGEVPRGTERYLEVRRGTEKCKEKTEREER